MTGSTLSGKTESSPRYSRTRGSKSCRFGLVCGALGVVAILVVWQILSLVVNPVFLASPGDTAKALVRLAWEGRLWVELLITLKRLVTGLLLGAAAGWALGILAGLDRRLRSFFEPVRWVVMTVPAVIIAMLAMLWFGLGDSTVIFMVAVIVFPTMFVNTVSGAMSVDTRLVEMARVYRFPRRLMLTEVYLPAIASPVLAGLTLAAGIGVRAVVLGEVLGATSGIGHAFSRAHSWLETDELFAWIVVLLLLMGVIEFGALRPLRKRAARWRSAGS